MTSEVSLRQYAAQQRAFVSAHHDCHSRSTAFLPAEPDVIMQRSALQVFDSRVTLLAGRSICQAAREHAALRQGIACSLHACDVVGSTTTDCVCNTGDPCNEETAGAPKYSLPACDNHANKRFRKARGQKVLDFVNCKISLKICHKTLPAMCIPGWLLSHAFPETQALTAAPEM